MFIIQIIFLLAFPFVVLKVTKSFRKFEFISPILVCYIVGILLANIPYKLLDRSLSMTISEAVVPLAIPLILFPANFIKWLKLAKKTVISFCLVIISAMASSVIGTVIFAGRMNEYWKVAGMLTGVYTGGTPNLMAVGMGLGVNEETLVLVNGSDAILGGIYFVFLLAVAKRLLGKFLPPFKFQGSVEDKTEDKPVYNSEKVKKLSFTIGLSIVIVGISIGASMLVFGKIAVAAVLLIVTTLGIAGSFITKVRSVEGTYSAGQYLLLIFSLSIGTTVNLGEMVSSSSTVFVFTAFVMTAAIIIHFILAAIVRIDVDTTIITSTAGIFGPAFIPPIASALKNREIVVSGLVSGLVGYAVGNYLGLLMGFLLMPK